MVNNVKQFCLLYLFKLTKTIAMENKKFTHILQKKGILKTFSVAKVVKRNDIKELEKLIKQIAADDKEYNQLLKEEMEKISNMHDQENPIPGIIYVSGNSQRRDQIFALAKKMADNLSKQKFSKSELALLISSTISKLGLEQEDFVNLNKELSEELGEDTEEDDESEDEEYED